MNLKKILEIKKEHREVRSMFTRKGQSTLEYVIVLTAIVAGIIFAATKFIQPRVQGSLDSISGKMQTEVENIQFGSK